MQEFKKLYFFENITYRTNDVNQKNTNHAVIWNDDVVCWSQLKREKSRRFEQKNIL
jgi:hypothetical protein